jgi:hypothetical protein
MIQTDEDDEFERIQRENAMKGQPYHWEAEAIKAAINIEREACAKVADNLALTSRYKTQRNLAEWCASSIRARGQA